MIVTLYHCKECFCGFVAKLRCCQVFLQRKRSLPVGGFITLIVAVFLFEEKLLSWPFLSQLTDVSSISLKRTFLLFRCYITLFSAFLHCMEILVF